MKSTDFNSAKLKNRKPETKIGSTISECLNILFDAPYGCILGSLFYLIFIADLFHLNYHLDFASYADTPLPRSIDRTLTVLLSGRTKCQ